MAFPLLNFDEPNNVAWFERLPGGTLREINHLPEPTADAISGFFSVTKQGLASLSRVGQSIELRIDDRSWDLSWMDLTIEFSRNDDGTSVFGVLRDAVPDFSLSYPSWWITNPWLVDMIEGAPEDEEIDFLAYAAQLWRDGERRRTMIGNLANSLAAEP